MSKHDVARRTALLDDAEKALGAKDLDRARQLLAQELDLAGGAATASGDVAAQLAHQRRCLAERSQGGRGLTTSTTGRRTG